MTDAEFVEAVRSRASSWPKSWDAYWDIHGILEAYDSSRKPAEDSRDR